MLNPWAMPNSDTIAFEIICSSEHSLPWFDHVVYLMDNQEMAGPITCALPSHRSSATSLLEETMVNAQSGTLIISNL